MPYGPFKAIVWCVVTPPEVSHCPSGATPIPFVISTVAAGPSWVSPHHLAQWTDIPPNVLLPHYEPDQKDRSFLQAKLWLLPNREGYRDLLLDDATAEAIPLELSPGLELKESKRRSLPVLSLEDLANSHLWLKFDFAKQNSFHFSIGQSKATNQP